MTRKDCDRAVTWSAGICKNSRDFLDFLDLTL